MHALALSYALTAKFLALSVEFKKYFLSFVTPGVPMGFSNKKCPPIWSQPFGEL